MGRWVINSVILVALAAQVAAAARPFSWALQQRRQGILWPFLDYGMYARAHYAGEALDEHALIGIFPDGSHRPLGPEQFDLTLRGYLDGPVAALQQEDRRRLARFMARAEGRLPRTLSALRLERRPHELSRQGLVAHPWQVVRVVDRAFWQGDPS